MDAASAWMLRQGVDYTAARLSTSRPGRGLGQQRRQRKGKLIVRALPGSTHRVGARLEKRIVRGSAGARRRRVRGNRR